MKQVLISLALLPLGLYLISCGSGPGPAQRSAQADSVAAALQPLLDSVQSEKELGFLFQHIESYQQKLRGWYEAGIAEENAEKMGLLTEAQAASYRDLLAFFKEVKKTNWPGPKPCATTSAYWNALRSFTPGLIRGFGRISQK
ncbi:MAG: hypothetical protein HC880_00305 [Bacteroidia bacterium]|nr:hypothetical protein [Bacteroidia bacterium]